MKEVSRFYYSTCEISKAKFFMDQEGHSDATVVPEDLKRVWSRPGSGGMWVVTGGGGEFAWRRLVDTRIS